MTKRNLPFVVPFAVLATIGLGNAFAAPLQHGKWIDLTHPFSEKTLYWPTAKSFSLEKEFHAHTDKGYFYAANRYSASEHGGTHLDAPIHFSEKGKTVDQLSLDQLSGDAVVIDVSRKAAANRDYQISVADLKAFEAKYGRIPNGTIVLFRTGFAKRWPDAEKYLGTAERGQDAVAKLHFPGLHPDAARWIVKNRSIKAVGLDTASIDYGQSKLFESHQILMGKNIPAFENVASLDKLPPTGSYIAAFPMKIQSGSGSPLRIAAMVK
jgi:kynurenine formamidase